MLLKESLVRARNATLERLIELERTGAHSNIASAMKSQLAVPTERHKELGQEKLRNLLAYAAERVPAYFGYESRELCSYPVTTRQKLAGNLGNYIARDLFTGALASRTVNVTTTSGSTGQAVTHLQSPLDEGVAGLVFRERMHRSFGIPHISEWLDLGLRLRSHAQPVVEGRFLPGLAIAWNMRTRREELPTFVAEYDAILEVARPNAIWGLPSRLLELANVLRKSNKKLQPTVVLTSYEQLNDAAKNLLTDIFQSPVISVYGTTEIGLCAIQCSAGSFHYWADHILVEILDENDKAVPEGVVGRLVITSLVSRCVPLIRYDTGDLACIGEKVCSCGNIGPRIDRLVGRQLPDFVSRSGCRTSPYRLLGYVAESGVCDFQLQQSRPGDMVLVLGDGEAALFKSNKVLSHLITRFEDEGLTLNVMETDAFITTAAGKRIPFVQRVPSFQ